MALWTGILDLPFLVCRHMYSARRDAQVLAAFILGRVMLCSYSDGSGCEGQGSFPGSSSTRGGERRRAFQEDADSTERRKAGREVFQWMWHTYSPTPATISTHTHSQSAQEHKTRVRVKPCDSDWDSNPWPELKHSQIHDLPLGSLTWLQHSMELRFLMTHHSKNSVRNKVVGKKWIYLERNTPQTECGPFQKKREASQYGVVSLYGLGNFMGQWMSDYFSYLGERAEISRNWATAPFLLYDGWPWNCQGTGWRVL